LYFYRNARPKSHTHTQDDEEEEHDEEVGAKAAGVSGRYQYGTWWNLPPTHKAARTNANPHGGDSAISKGNTQGNSQTVSPILLVCL